MILMRKVIAVVMASLLFAMLPFSAAAAGTATDPQQAVREMVAEITQSVAEEEKSSEPIVVCYGDIDKNGKVTSSDARRILMFCARMITLTREQCMIADFDANGTLTSSDARKALCTAAQINTPIRFDRTVSDPDQVLAQYSQFRDYVPSLSGFSTNIRDPKVFPKLKELENYCASQQQRVTFYYTDVQGRYYISYNSNWKFRTQCTIKAPYVKSILAYMEQHNISPDKKLQLHSNEKWKNHNLSKYPTGTWFTIRDLIYHTIRNSDNTAYQMLYDYFGAAVFNESARKAGSSLRLSGYIFGETTAADMAKLYLDIYRFNGKYKNILFEDMKNASHNKDMIGRGVPSNITFIHKFGNGEDMTVGLHDCAVIYTQVPCVLVIYTSLNAYGDYSRVQFGEIAAKVIDVNRNLEYD